MCADVVKPTWSFIDGGNAFPRVEDYEQHVNTQYAGASPVPKGTNGIYSSSVEDVFDAHFQKKDDRAMSVARRWRFRAAAQMRSRSLARRRRSSDR